MSQAWKIQIQDHEYEQEKIAVRKGHETIHKDNKLKN